MGVDKNFSRSRLKLQQDELARSDPKITHSTLLPFVCQNHIATGVLLVLGTNTTSNLNSYAPMTAETTRKPAVQRGVVRPGMGERLDRLHQATKKSSETPLLSTKTHHSFPSEITSQVQASYQVILTKPKLHPGAWGGQTGYRGRSNLLYPAKNSKQELLANCTKNDPRVHLNAPLIKANKLTEENLTKSKPRPGRPRAVRPPPSG
jgi:hypothetical protein